MMAATPEKWDVEDETFWEKVGKKVAFANRQKRDTAHHRNGN